MKRSSRDKYFSRRDDSPEYLTDHQAEEINKHMVLPKVIGTMKMTDKEAHNFRKFANTMHSPHRNAHGHPHSHDPYYGE